jgi:hypothetical protein
MTNLNKITSLDYIRDTIYNSKFSTWLINNYLTSLLTKDDWKLKTVDSNIFFDLNVSTGVSFIRTKFNVGVIHIASESDLDQVIEKIMEYGERPDLIANLFSETINSNGVMFLQLTYETNIYQGMDLVPFFNLIFDQIEMIKEDVRYMLNLKIVDPKNLARSDEYEDDDSEDDDGLSDDLISPYDVKGDS